MTRRDPLGADTKGSKPLPEWLRTLLIVLGAVGGFFGGAYWAAEVLGPLLENPSIPSGIGELAQLGFPFGLALLLGAWAWKWRRFPMGRVLGILLIVPGLGIWTSQKVPTPVAPATVERGAQGTFDPAKLHIQGVVPGMSQEKVLELLGPPPERGAVTKQAEWGTMKAQTFVYPDQGLEIIYREDGTVGSVRGIALQEKDGDLIKKGQARAKIEGQFGPPRSLTTEPNRASYDFWHPGFTVYYDKDVVTSVSLYDDTAYDGLFDLGAP